MDNRCPPDQEKAIYLTHIKGQLERNHPTYAMVREEALYCLDHGFLLSHDEKLWLGTALLASSDDPEIRELGLHLWRAGSRYLLRHQQIERVVRRGLLLANAAIKRDRYEQLYEALLLIRDCIDRLPAGSASYRLEYIVCVDQYARHHDDADVAEELLP